MVIMNNMMIVILLNITLTMIMMIIIIIVIAQALAEAPALRLRGAAGLRRHRPGSGATCLTQVFFKSDE